jgi:hypothetical protein
MVPPRQLLSWPKSSGHGQFGQNCQAKFLNNVYHSPVLLTDQIATKPSGLTTAPRLPCLLPDSSTTSSSPVANGSVTMLSCRRGGAPDVLTSEPARVIPPEQRSFSRRRGPSAHDRAEQPLHPSELSKHRSPSTCMAGLQSQGGRHRPAPTPIPTATLHLHCG